MWDIFIVQCLVDNLPLKIESFCSSDKRLLIGTSDGSLLLYHIQDGPNLNIQLLETRKGFSKKPINQISVFRDSFLCLTDGQVDSYDMQSLSMNISIPKSKGATLFSLFEGGAETHLCIVVKRKLLLFRYGSNTWMEYGELTLPDRARTIKWLDDSKIAFAIPKGYYFVNTVSGSIVELLGLGSTIVGTLGALGAVQKQTKYTIASLDNGQLLLGKDAAGVFVNSDGTPLIERDLEWTMAPEEIEQLISSSRFIEAQRLIEELDFSTEEEKTANVIRVRGLYAHHLFTIEKRYEEAVSILAELKASPVDVINLYPQFSLMGKLGEDVQDRVALQTLLDYLTNQRTILSKLRDFSSSVPRPKAPYSDTEVSSANSLWSGSVDGYTEGYSMRFPSMDDTLYLSEVVDTTLLKLFLVLNDALVGPLVRIKNFCNVQESEEILKSHRKYRELTDFYYGKGEHEKALTFLLERAMEDDAQMVFLTNYLKRLDLASNLDRIQRFTECLLKVDPEGGLQVFKERFEEIDLTVHREILDFLEKISPYVEADYLEHMISELSIDAPEYHDRLVLNYLQTIMRALVANEDQKQFSSVREKLSKFLNSSKHYRAERILPLFPEDALYQERALLLGRLGKHSEALSIYIKVLGDLDAAERYCVHQDELNPIQSSTENVFTILLDILLSESQESENIFSFLLRHATKIDLAHAFNAFPGTFKLSDVLGFSKRSLQSLLWQKSTSKIVENITKADHLEVKSLRQTILSQRVTITDDRMCPRCLRRVGNSVFAVSPNGTIMHVFCQSR
ncbi:hypothetical protein HDU97_001681 [Phlyctochytrium planicorne]|nr:hypothetical protein HDU97_001681 [Phlyctochytrium planicorne]